MTDYTPGPWRLNEPRFRDHCGSRIEVYGPYWKPEQPRNKWPFTVACVTCASPNADANARLIAAAPETADERDRLKVINAELLRALQNLMTGNPGRNGWGEDYRVWQDAKAAIAKAEGGES